MLYRSRIADDILEQKLEAFGATLITGPKGCGKTTTGKQKAASVVEFQDEDTRENLLAVAQTQPSRLLLGAKPRLFDEWQDAPKIWGAVRKSVDDEQKTGLYILTGSTSQAVDTPHTGTQRISTLKMYPMSLFESGESNGEVSLSALFDHPDKFQGCHSNLTVDHIIWAICRGGWPRAINNPTPRAQLAIAKDLFYQICNVDISHVDGVKRNSAVTEAILRSYSRNLCTMAEILTIRKDVLSTENISESSLYEYLKALKQLFVIEDVPAWCPAIRSKSAIRAGNKRCFTDPSMAVAALGLKPEYFNTDFKTLGFLFEALCIRDLRIYSSKSDGRVSYYHDRYGLEADAVLHLADGRYALIEIKLGSHEIDYGAKHLVELEKLMREKNATETQVPLALPTLKIVLTGTEYGYRRDDGVFVIPLGCLRD